MYVHLSENVKTVNGSWTSSDIHQATQTTDYTDQFPKSGQEIRSLNIPDVRENREKRMESTRGNLTFRNGLQGYY